MIIKKQGGVLLTLICFSAAALFISTGCSVLPRGKEGQAAKGAGKKKEQTPLYYEFEDVLIPRELKVDRDESFIYQASGISAGLLTLKARIELDSLITFFEKNMRKDNWRLIGSFKSGRTMLLFQKDNRWCVINITESGFDYNTRVEIWVAPSMRQSTSGSN